ncbi:MAG: response regulator [Bacteroidales bacterium]|nr:response regulator [Bacteroidales bacterium]
MKKVLVIDDSEVSLFLIESIFENDMNVEVLMEEDSRNAIRKIKYHLPDVIILDLMMPKIDGFEVLYQIKADPGLKNIPILVVSARHDKDALNKAEEFGVAGFVKKPIELNDIEVKIRELLESPVNHMV